MKPKSYLFYDGMIEGDRLAWLLWNQAIALQKTSKTKRFDETYDIFNLNIDNNRKRYLR